MPSVQRYKIATDKWEFDEIKKLNYETFAEEIPQHQRNSSRQHTDKFHKENVYIICIKDTKLLGMLAVRDRRPFSLDQKLQNLDSYLPSGRRICEIRLLAIKKDVRFTRVLKGLLEKTARYCIEKNFDTAVISAILNQQKLYRHIGFVPFGPLVGTAEARFQPMKLTVEAHAESRSPMLTEDTSHKANFLPGPVDVSPAVKSAFARPAISHRSDEFLKIHNKTKSLLTELVNTKHVEIITGSGTLANDVIAGQLSLLNTKGLIVSNGEFGERLIKHAENLRLKYKTICFSWGEPFINNIIKKTAGKNPDIKWIWAVHSETSTGMLNDIDLLKAICRDNNILLCLDCISSTGNVQLDLSDIYLASAASSKGLSSFPGLCMVFYNHHLKPPQIKLPEYLNLYKYANANGIAYTISSNHVSALLESLKNLDIKKKAIQNSLQSDLLRSRLDEMGLKIITPKTHAGGFVITLSLDKKHDSIKIGNSLKDAGFRLSYKSRYLVKNNWIQICLMSDIPTELIHEMLVKLEKNLSL